MSLVDFLVYHFCKWFERREKKVRIFSPLTEAIQIIAFLMVILMIWLTGVVGYIYFNTMELIIPYPLFVIALLGIIFFLHYVYNTRGRYSKIVRKKFCVSEETGILIILYISLFIISLFLLTATIFWEFS